MSNDSCLFPSRTLRKNRASVKLLIMESTLKPHYHGHRQRLRERYAQGGVKGLAPYEVVELILFYAVLRQDVKPLAKDLLSRFGTLVSLLNASSGELKKVKGVSERVVETLTLFRDIGLLQQQQSLTQRPILANWKHLIDYCSMAMAHERQEQVRLLFLDCKSQLICDEVQQVGTVNHAPLYPREVVKRALEIGASSLIIVHNHPSGDPTPSQADILITREVNQAARTLGIDLYDHIIIGQGRYVSLKSRGLF